MKCLFSFVCQGYLISAMSLTSCLGRINIFVILAKLLLREYAQKVSRFWSPCALLHTHASPFLFVIVYFCCYAKIAGSIGILPRRVLNDFFTFYKGMNVCPICAASLSHHTLCMGNITQLAVPKIVGIS